MLVTCYYDIYQRPHKFMEYLYLFYDLGISGIPIVLFTDPSLVYKFRIFPSVTVIGVPLHEFELYNIAMKYERDLPIHRNVEKDTKEFFALMNMKVECIKRARDLLTAPSHTYMWIDFGILKIVKNTEAFLAKLQQLNTLQFQKMIVPGCWQFGRHMSVEMIHWRFCGGFFIMPEHYIDTFYGHSKTVLTDFCTKPQYKLTWETNIWTVIESCAELGNIIWYSADHNDSIVMSIDGVLPAAVTQCL